jgi:hypothetical protein
MLDFVFLGGGDGNVMRYTVKTLCMGWYVKKKKTRRQLILKDGRRRSMILNRRGKNNGMIRLEIHMAFKADRPRKSSIFFEIDGKQ